MCLSPWVLTVITVEIVKLNNGFPSFIHESITHLVSKGLIPHLSPIYMGSFMYPHLVPSKTPQFLPMFSWETRTKVRSLLSFPMLRKDFVGSPLKGSLQKNTATTSTPNTFWYHAKKKRSSLFATSPKSIFLGGGPNYIYFLGGAARNILILKANPVLEFVVFHAQPQRNSLPFAAWTIWWVPPGTKMPGGNKDMSRMSINTLKSLQTSRFDWRFQKEFPSIIECLKMWSKKTCIYKCFAWKTYLSSKLLNMPSFLHDTYLTCLGVSCTKYLIGARQFLTITILVLVGNHLVSYTSRHDRANPSTWVL